MKRDPIQNRARDMIVCRGRECKDSNHVACRYMRNSYRGDAASKGVVLWHLGFRLVLEAK